MARGATRQAQRQKRRGRQPHARKDDIPTFGPAAGEGAMYPPSPTGEGLTMEVFRVPGLNEGPGPPTALYVPTVALEKMCSLAEREDLEFVLDRAVLATVAKRGTHMLHNLHRVTGPGGVDFVRCFARILVAGDPEERGDLLRDGRVTEPRAYEVFLDFPTRYVGMMVEAGRSRGRKPERPKAPPRVPRWAGSWSFDPVYAELERIERMPPADPDLPAHPVQVLAGRLASSMRDAHVVVIDPEQVVVLPEWEEWEQLWDYTADAELPFEPLYLDLEGPGGVAPRVSQQVTLVDRDGAARPFQVEGMIRGAVLNRAEGVLGIAPLGEYWTGGEEVPEPSYAPMGMVLFQLTGEPDESGVGTTSLGVVAGEEVHSCVVTTPEVTGADTPGYVIVPSTERELREHGEWNVRACASIVLACASRAAAALSITESDAVVIEEADVDNRDRHRAEKRGWPIADKVFIRPVRKGGERRGEGGEREFSHRFWVRGHTKHFPLGTRVADARPDLVRPCTRGGDASCGFCRRVWTPPFIKGPDDRPLVLKSLVKRRDAGDG